MGFLDGRRRCPAGVPLQEPRVTRDTLSDQEPSNHWAGMVELRGIEPLTS